MKYIKRVIVLIIAWLFFLPQVLAITPGDALFAKSATCDKNRGESWFNSVTIDKKGYLYTAGWILGNDPYGFGNGVTVSGTCSISGQQSAVLVKYDNEGNAQWAKSTTNTPVTSWFNSVSADDYGNIYASGYVKGNDFYGFGNGVTVSGASTDLNIVLVKYDSNGIAQWAKSIISGTGISELYSVTTDSSGNIYVAGSISGSDAYGFGNGVMVSGAFSSGTNTILVKYDKNGEPLWAKSVESSTDSSSFLSVAVDYNGNIYTAGYISGQGTYDFGSGVAVSGTSNQFQNVVLVKYDKNGEPLWAKNVISSETNVYSMFNSVAASNNGTVFAAGVIAGSNVDYNFGNGVIVSGPSWENIGLVKYGNEGNAQWAKSVSSGSNSQFTSVTVDDEENLYAVGSIYGIGNYDFGNGIIINAISDQGGDNIIIVKYDSGGNPQWAKSITNDAYDSGFLSVAIAKDHDISLCAAGYIAYSDTYNFGNGVTINGSSGYFNPVLVKYFDVAPSSDSDAPTRSWWSRNGDYVLVAIGGVVVTGGVVAGFASGASCMGASSLAKAVTSCACISCIVNAVGSVAVVVTPILSKVLAPATKAAGGEMQQSLIAGTEDIT